MVITPLSGNSHGALGLRQGLSRIGTTSTIAPIGDPPHAVVATVLVEPIGPAEPIGDLLRVHEQAGIQLRVLDNLWPFWEQVIVSTLGFSGIRLRNARCHPRHRRPDDIRSR
ncbi:MAG: DUF6886 family protein [Pseudonocardiaceae bacterium]